MNLNLLELVPEYFKCPICGLWHKSFSDTTTLKSLSNRFILWDCKTYETYYPPKRGEPRHRYACLKLVLYPNKRFFEFTISPLPGCRRHIRNIKIYIDFNDMIIGKEHPTITANLQLKLVNPTRDYGCRYCDYKGWCNMKTVGDEKNPFIRLNMTLGLAFNKEEFDKALSLDDKHLKYEKIEIGPEYEKIEIEIGPEYDEPVNSYLPYSPTQEAIYLVNKDLE